MNIEWISIKERLPEENGQYLVVVDYVSRDTKPYVKILNFSHNLKLHPFFRYDDNVKNCQSGWWDSDIEDDWIVTGVTYWMPLPEVPEEE